MKIQIDETISVSFDPQSLTRAAVILEEIKAKHPETFADICNGLLTFLLFRQIETNSPGTLGNLLWHAEKANEKIPQP